MRAVRFIVASESVVPFSSALERRALRKTWLYTCTRDKPLPEGDFQRKAAIVCRCLHPSRRLLEVVRNAYLVSQHCSGEGIMDDVIKAREKAERRKRMNAASRKRRIAEGLDAKAVVEEAAGRNKARALSPESIGTAGTVPTLGPVTVALFSPLAESATNAISAPLPEASMFRSARVIAPSIVGKGGEDVGDAVAPASNNSAPGEASIDDFSWTACEDAAGHSLILAPSSGDIGHHREPALLGHLKSVSGAPVVGRIAQRLPNCVVNVRLRPSLPALSGDPTATTAAAETLVGMAKPFEQPLHSPGYESSTPQHWGAYCLHKKLRGLSNLSSEDKLDLVEAAGLTMGKEAASEFVQFDDTHGGKLRATIMKQYAETQRAGHDTGCSSLTEQLSLSLSRLAYPAAEAASMVRKWEMDFKEANPETDMTQFINDSGKEGLINNK